MVEKSAVGSFYLKREYINVAQFGLVSLLSPYASRRDWDFGRMDNPVKSL